jgi:hypothetical protein
VCEEATPVRTARNGWLDNREALRETSAGGIHHSVFTPSIHTRTGAKTIAIHLLGLAPEGWWVQRSIECVATGSFDPISWARFHNAVKVVLVESLAVWAPLEPRELSS